MFHRKSQPFRRNLYFHQNVHFNTKVTRDAKSNVLIPTEPFLNASGDFLPILDKLGSKAFQPVKMDISGNIAKIRTKYDTDTDKFTSLQAGDDILFH